jgi:hypothetical protein
MGVPGEGGTMERSTVLLREREPVVSSMRDDSWTVTGGGMTVAMAFVGVDWREDRGDGVDIIRNRALKET